MIHCKHFEEVMIRADHSQMVDFLRLLLDEPDLPSGVSSDQVLQELAEAVGGVANTVPEFQDVVKKSPAVQLLWLALQLRMSVGTISNMVMQAGGNPMQVKPKILDKPEVPEEGKE